MTNPIDFLIDSSNGQRSITITPINVTLASGILYATGQYALSEGEIGMGTISFDKNHEWGFDGITSISESDIRHIVDLIRETDGIPNPLVSNGEPEIISGGGTQHQQTASEQLTFVVQHHDMPVDVSVEIKYPVYDVSLAGKFTAQLEQDHHSNWYVAKGQLDDRLVQEIGRRIVEYITS